MRGLFQFRTVEVHVKGELPGRLVPVGYQLHTMPALLLREPVELARRDLELVPGAVLSAAEVRELAHVYDVESFVTNRSTGVAVSREVFDACLSEALPPGMCVDVDIDTYAMRMHPDAPIEPSAADTAAAEPMTPEEEGLPVTNVVEALSEGEQGPGSLEKVLWRPTTVAGIDAEMERLRGQLATLREDRARLASGGAVTG